MPRRLSFTRLSLFEQPLVYIAGSSIVGLLFASRYAYSIRAWVVLCAGLWLTASFCLTSKRGRLLAKRGGQSEWIVTGLLLLLSFACGGALWAIDKAGVG